MEIVSKLIKQEEYLTTEWSGGKTTQLFIYPQGAIYKDFNFKFRLSSATVELEKSEFTILKGIHRFITPLDKELKLTHNHKDYINLAPFEIYEFDGGINTTSYGTARDFNLMLAKDTKGELQSIYIDGEYLLEEEYHSDFKDGFVFIFAYNDEVDIKINGDIKFIKPFEMLLIRLNNNSNLSLMIKSNKPTNILKVRVSINSWYKFTWEIYFSRV